MTLAIGRRSHAAAMKFVRIIETEGAHPSPRPGSNIPLPATTATSTATTPMDDNPTPMAPPSSEGVHTTSCSPVALWNRGVRKGCSSRRQMAGQGRVDAVIQSLHDTSIVRLGWINTEVMRT